MAEGLGTSSSATGASAARRWLSLAVVLVGAFMALLDAAVVNVAIPSIRADFNAGYGAVGLVVTAYTMTYACLLITGGRLGDFFGRRRIFIVGLSLFTIASALCNAASSITVLIVARAIQGIGGAMLYPQVLSTIQVTFTGEERTRATRASCLRSRAWQPERTSTTRTSWIDGSSCFGGSGRGFDRADVHKPAAGNPFVTF